MKIAFLFGPWSIGWRPLNFYENNIWISTRGLTGSEIGILATAKEFVKLGHDVSLFTVHVPGTKPEKWEGIKLYHFEEYTSIINDTFDAVVSWSEPDILRPLPQKLVRVVCEMLNDFTFTKAGFDDAVDIWTAPSERLMQHLISQSPRPDKWTVVPLGCDPTWYSKRDKIKNSVVSISSPDRGLHLLLQQWPRIKKLVPTSTLRIFYHLTDGPLETYQSKDTTHHPNVLELAQRTRYIKYAIKKLETFDVSFIGSVSRNQIAEILSETEIAIAPLSTVAFSEGFSVATLEAMAAGCLPIIGDIDCLGSVYGGVAPMVPSPVEDNLEIFTKLVVRGLVDTDWRSHFVKKCTAFASQYTWENSAKQLEINIKKHLKFKGL